jgi:hypothetical protein
MKPVGVTVALLVASPASAASVEWRVADGGNGHFYEAILTPNGITWSDANNAAKAARWHLATITSAAENGFVCALVCGDPAFWRNVGTDTHGPWLGGFQPAGSSEPAGGFSWVTGEPFVYTNWATGEPNNAGDEDSIQLIGKGNNHIADTWNDLAGNYSQLPRGYIQELDVVPEPATFALFGAGLIGLLGVQHYGCKRPNLRECLRSISR